MIINLLLKWELQHNLTCRRWDFWPSVSHRQTVQSAEADSNSVSLGDQCKSYTSPWWPSNWANSFPSGTYLTPIINFCSFSSKCLKHSTYLLTPCSRVLLEKLIGSQKVKKFPAFYGTWRFITIITSACHLSLSLKHNTLTKSCLYVHVLTHGKTYTIM